MHIPNAALPLPPGETTANYSGVAYLPDPAPATTGSFFIIENSFNGTDTNGAIHEYRYGFDGTPPTWTLLQRTLPTAPPPPPRLIRMTGFDNTTTGLNDGDPEAIVWKGPGPTGTGKEFAFIRERVGIFHDFFIDVDGDGDTFIDGDTNGDGLTDTIACMNSVPTVIRCDTSPSITNLTVNPNPAIGADTNGRLEGLAYNPAGGGRYYAAKELEWQNLDGANGDEILYEVNPAAGPVNNTTAIHVDDLSTPAVVGPDELRTELLGRDVSDIFYGGGHIFVLTELGLNQITRLTFNPLAGTSGRWEFDSTNGNDVRDRRDPALPPGAGNLFPEGSQPEGLTFSSDGFEMFVVSEPARFYHYRNFTAYTPTVAPDMDDADDTGRSSTDGITSNRQPHFTGTVPEGSYVRLYVDGGFVGDVDLPDGTTTYSIQPGAALAPGPHSVTIRLGERATSPATNWSVASPALSIIIYDPDVNADLTVDCTDVAILAANFGRTSGATFAQGDTNGDGRVDVVDLDLVQISLGSCGVRMMAPGGGGGGELIVGGADEGKAKGGDDGKIDEGGSGGGGESLLASTPARFYFTTSAAIPGGGALGTSVPAVTLPGPGQTVDLYVWVKMGTYRRLKGFGFDVRASVPGIVKAAQSQVYNADIWDVEENEDLGDRWNPNALLGGDLNPNGVGGAELAIASGSFGIGGGTDLLDRNDGTHGLLDTLYDATNDAFLLQRVRLEALPGSAGLSTGLVVSIGRLGIAIDNTTITSGLPIYFGLGTTSIENNQIGSTDGSIHATIAVAAGSPGAVFSAVAPPDTRRSVPMRTHVERMNRTNDRASVPPPTIESPPTTRSTASLRAVRRAVDSRAVDRLLSLY